MQTQDRTLDAVKRSIQFLIYSLQDDGTGEVSITSYACVRRNRFWAQVCRDTISQATHRFQTNAHLTASLDSSDIIQSPFVHVFRPFRIIAGRAAG